MKQKILAGRSGLILGTFLGLGLFLFLVVYSQGAVVSAADPGLAHSGRGEITSVENTALEAIYLPIILNNYPTDEDTLFPEDLIISTLAGNSAARWSMELVSGDVITINVAPGTMVDIVLSVIDEGGTSLVDQQNLSPAGEVETISNLDINKTGQYDLVISTQDGKETDYALMLLNQDSYTFDFRGTFFNTGSQNDSLPEDTDHFWFFNALTGDSVSFTITPLGDEDPYVELFGPDTERILVLDDNGAGEPESLENYTVPDSGLYSIRVGEFDFLPMDYQISVSK